MTRLRFAFHNIVIHPICGGLWLIGATRLADRLHGNEPVSDTANSPAAPVAETAGEAVAWVNPQELRIFLGSSNLAGRAINLRKAQDGYTTDPLYASPVPAQDDDKLRIAVEAWDELAKRPGLEISFNGFGEEDGWVVHRVTGGVNDREWEEMACADTPLEALQEALAALKAEGK